MDVINQPRTIGYTGVTGPPMSNYTKTVPAIRISVAWEVYTQMEHTVKTCKVQRYVDCQESMQPGGTTLRLWGSKNQGGVVFEERVKVNSTLSYIRISK